ncbi:MAG: hypothetical protein ABFC34_08435 [Methanobacterium sp.]|jgi:hypothetical protein
MKAKILELTYTSSLKTGPDKMAWATIKLDGYSEIMTEKGWIPLKTYDERTIEQIRKLTGD